MLKIIKKKYVEVQLLSYTPNLPKLTPQNNKVLYVYKYNKLLEVSY